VLGSIAVIALIGQTHTTWGAASAAPAKSAPFLRILERSRFLFSSQESLV